MKKQIYFFLLFFSLSISSQNYRTIDNQAFGTGEKLTYHVVFNSLLTGNVNAGKLTLEVMPNKKQIAQRSAYHVVAQINSSGMVKLFYKVDDRFESYIDDKAMVPHKFLQRKRENNYRKEDTLFFNQLQKKAKNGDNEFDIPAHTQDMVSALYHARTLHFVQIEIGSLITIPIVIDDTVYHSKIVYVGRQVVKTKMGEFNCFAFKPMVATGKVFDQQYPMTFWVTDDSNRMPVLIETKLSVGKARIEINSYEGLLKPMRSAIAKRK